MSESVVSPFVGSVAGSVMGAASAPVVDPFAQMAERLNALGQSLHHKTQAAVASGLARPVSQLAAVPEVAVGFWVGCLVAVTLLGFRLRQVNKPESQLLSPVIRSLGSCMAWGGLAAVFLAILGGCLLVGGLVFIDRAEIFNEYFERHAVMAVVGAVLGSAVILPLLLRVIPLWERGAGLPDVEELVRDFKHFQAYNPRPYFKLAKGCFLGRGRDGKPIYLPWEKLRETHVQVLGTTGSGKGVLMVMVAVQAVAAGEAVVWFDPKADRFAPRLLAQAAHAAGRPFALLDLNLGQPPQFSLFAGASEFEILDLFVAGFDLRGKGTDGDFHRGRDEDAAMVAANMAATQDIRSIAGLVAACAGVEEVTSAENFWRHLRKLARVAVIDAVDGVDLASAIAQQGVVYVRGSADTEVVKMLQKMVLARVAQIIKARPEADYGKQVCVVLDELKHLLSTPALTSLGVIRSFGAHFLLAHQSLGDLDGCAGIPPVEVRGAVIDNTALKVVYRINDGEYADWLSKAAGRRRTFVEATTKGAEEERSQGGWREQHVQFLNPDLLTHLPLPSDRKGQASNGVLLGWGNARLFYLGPMPAAGDMPQPVEVAAGEAEQVEEPI